MAPTKKNNEGIKLGEKVKNIIFSTQGLPIFLSFTTVAILFVLFRMKNVEMDYQITKAIKILRKF